PQDARSYCAEAVLAVAQRTSKAPVDAGRDERASRQAEKFIKPAVELTRSACQSRCRDVVCPIRQNRFDKMWYVLGVVRAIRIEETRNWRFDVRDGFAEGSALSGAAFVEHDCATLGGNLGSAIGRLANNHKDLIRIASGTFDDVANGRCFLFCGNDDRHL